jgi:hypothetical protein
MIAGNKSGGFVPVSFLRVGLSLFVEPEAVLRAGSTGTSKGRGAGRRLRRGDVVEVLSRQEILATLDEDGCLDGLPFMPEMIRFCGERRRVYRRAALVCVENVEGRRWMKDAVLLEEASCDGSAHDGCQRDCLIFWKEAWLRNVVAGNASNRQMAPGTVPQERGGAGPAAGPATTHDCQSARLHTATVPCSTWEPPQYLADLAAGNMRAGEFLAFARDAVARRLRRLVSRTGHAWPKKTDALATPGGLLCLQPGEIVEVRSREEVLATLDGRRRNRGLTFEMPMLDSCGRRFRVARRVDRIIIETTGEMKTIKDTVVLHGVNCRACPRSNPFYWREIWLKRAE